ncbi:hypothetical protein BSPCLSOX_2578, partial [uncultured Gammaproteobacteria bacterium]
MQRSQAIITKEVIMQTKINSVAIRATNATGAGKTSTLKIGDKIIVTVTLSETVVVTGEPTYTISIGGVNKSATYVSTASNANTLVFSYTIASGDMTTTGITATTTALSLNTGSIKDTAGNAIQLATPAVASSANTITVDAKAPNAVDLNSATDVQPTSKALFTRSEIAVGVAFDADIANTTDTDIKSIKVVLGGVGFNATNDKLILDTDITLRSDI